VRFASGNDVHSAVPVFENVNGQAGGTSETEQPDSFARFYARHAQAPVAYNSGAQERCDISGLQPWGQWINEIGSNKDVLSITSVHRVAGEDGPVAKILESMLAIPASAVRSTHPGNTDSAAQRHICRCTMHDLADNLMSGNEVRFQRREFILRDMEICPAYPARQYPK
jgi:hypothetical protein